MLSRQEKKRIQPMAKPERVVFGRCHAAVKEPGREVPLTVWRRKQCPHPSLKKIVLCRHHNKHGGLSVFMNGMFVGWACNRGSRR